MFSVKIRFAAFIRAAPTCHVHVLAVAAAVLCLAAAPGDGSTPDSPACMFATLGDVTKTSMSYFACSSSDTP